MRAGVPVAGRDEDGVVGHGGERDRRGPLGRGEGAASLSQHARGDPEAHRSLVGASLPVAVAEKGSKARERRRLVLVPPQIVELLRVGLVRRPHCLRGERQHLLAQGEPSRAPRAPRPQRARTSRASR